MRIPFTFLSLLFVTTLPAQTQLLRGDVDTIQGTNQFQLECTGIRLVSQTVNLRALHDASRQQDIEYEMQVRDVSQGGQTILDVVSAKVIPEMFDMGNIRIGRADTWEVFGAPGSTAGIFVSLPAWTLYAPLGASGTWLLGPNVLLAKGTVNAQGRYQFRFQPPNMPSLVGMTFVGQGALVSGNVLTLTNLDCKEVRPN